jgi:hypothetical protein
MFRLKIENKLDISLIDPLSVITSQIFDLLKSLGYADINIVNDTIEYKGYNKDKDTFNESFASRYGGGKISIKRTNQIYSFTIINSIRRTIKWELILSVGLIFTSVILYIFKKSLDRYFYSLFIITIVLTISFILGYYREKSWTNYCQNKILKLIQDHYSKNIASR